MLCIFLIKYSLKINYVGKFFAFFFFFFVSKLGEKNLDQVPGQQDFSNQDTSTGSTDNGVVR